MSVYRRTGSPYWWVRLPRPGRPALRESTLVPITAPTETDRAKNKALAERIYAVRMGDLARERHQLPVREAPAPEKMGDWLTWYETHILPTHRGKEREAWTLTRLRAEFGTLALPDVTRERVAEWVTRRSAERNPRTKRPVSAATVNREMDLLKAILRSAADHGRIEASPIAGMTRLHTVTPQRRVMSREDEGKLLAAIRAPSDRALLIMGLDTLCRMGDCLDLQRRDDHGETLWIRDPKTNGGYAVPVTTRLRAALDAIPRRTPEGQEPDPDEYYFHRRRLGEPAKTRNGVRQMLQHAAARAGVAWGRAAGGLTWHWATRRTAATRMLQAGVDLATVQRAGHWRTSAMVLDIYAGTEDARVRAAVEGIGCHSPRTVAEESAESGAKPQK